MISKICKRRKGDSLKRILIIEDDNLLNNTLAYNLRLDGYNVSSAFNFRIAKEKLMKSEYDMVLLDINLPDGNGFDLAKFIKTKNIDILLIFLTANDEERSQINAFDLGAIDYVNKPFSIAVLRRKINVMFTKFEKNDEDTEIYNDGNLIIDFSKFSSSLNGETLILSPMEYKMLYLFCKNPKQVLTRRKILEKLWDLEGNYVDEHTLTTTISRLRNKIDIDDKKYIKTIYGIGYQWVGGES